MTVTMKDVFIVFKATPQGPMPVMVETNEQHAMLFIAESQRITRQMSGWSYVKCPMRQHESHRVVAGQMPGYHVSKRNFGLD